MIFKHIKLLCLVGLFAFVTACGQGESVESRVAAAHKRNDGPAIWKVTDSNSTVYLFGSVHMLPDGVKWQRRDMQAAFDSVGTVFFEIPDGTKAELETSILQQKHGLYSSGERLSDYMDSAMLNHFAAAAHNADIPQEALEGFKPWLVADLLSVAAANAAGLRAENSADMVMREKAKSASKVIKSLDAVDTYIEAVALQPNWVQMQNLEDTIKDFDTLGNDLQRVTAAWLSGNVPFIEEKMVLPYREKSPKMYEALFADRNNKWAKTLDDFMRGNTDAMVVVGIGHLVGPDSLAALLKERGYTVERHRRFDLPN